MSVLRAGLCSSPLCGIFHSLILSRLLTACFRWVLDLELGALQGLCSSLAAVLVYPSLSALWAFFVSSLCRPPSSHYCQIAFFVLKCCCSPLSTFLYIHWFYPQKKQNTFWGIDTQVALISQNSVSFISICVLSFSFGVKTGKKCVWTTLPLSPVALIPLLPSVSPSFS